MHILFIVLNPTIGCLIPNIFCKNGDIRSLSSRVDLILMRLILDLCLKVIIWSVLLVNIYDILYQKCNKFKINFQIL